jgi:hypothetical protein
MSSDTRTEILALGTRWAEAEQSADAGFLDQVTANGFRLVGPFGFVLDLVGPFGFVLDKTCRWLLASMHLSQAAPPARPG